MQRCWLKGGEGDALHARAVRGGLQHPLADAGAAAPVQGQRPEACFFGPDGPMRAKAHRLVVQSARPGGATAPSTNRTGAPALVPSPAKWARHGRLNRWFRILQGRLIGFVAQIRKSLILKKIFYA